MRTSPEAWMICSLSMTMPTWVIRPSSSPKNAKSPGCVSCRKYTNSPHAICWLASRGRRSPHNRAQTCVRPEQSMPMAQRPRGCLNGIGMRLIKRCTQTQEFALKFRNGLINKVDRLGFQRIVFFLADFTKLFRLNPTLVISGILYGSFRVKLER